MAAHDPSFDPSNPAPPNVHEPFTTAERIQQLSAVDKVRRLLPPLPPLTTNPPTQDITSLLHHTSLALRCIANPPSSPSGPSPPSPPSSDPLSNFKLAQSDFISTLDRIDKVLKRHIFALEEAGIITLRGAEGGVGASADAGGGGQDGGAKDGPVGGGGGGAAGGSSSASASKAVVARLDPDGMGRIGAFDVGHLNMASSAVERDMEGELWARAREVLFEEEKEREGRMEE